MPTQEGNRDASTEFLPTILEVWTEFLAPARAQGGRGAEHCGYLRREAADQVATSALSLAHILSPIKTREKTLVLRENIIAHFDLGKCKNFNNHLSVLNVTLKKKS